MNVEYIKLLMLYSDVKYPYVKAKTDPGLSEGLKDVNKFIQKNGSYKLSNAEAKAIMLMEKHVKTQVRDIDEDYVPKPKKE
jgi:hypothetical protein